MQSATRRFLSAVLLLLAVFSAVHLRVAYPPSPKPVVVRHWADMRPLVPDSVLYDFVRQLLAQSDSEPPRPFSKTNADFWISRVLFEHAPVSLHVPYMKDADFRYRYGAESAPMLKQLYAEHTLSAADTAFMHQQIVRSTAFRLDPHFLPGCKVIPVELLKHHMKQNAGAEGISDGALSRLKSEYQTKHIAVLSAPLFSLDLHLAVTTVMLNVGAFCGVGNRLEVVMKKEKGRWRKFRAVTY